MIGRTLNIGFTAQRVDAAAGNSHIAEQELDHRHASDILHADSMLRPAHSVHNRTRFTHGSGSGVLFVDLQKFFRRRAGDFADDFGSVA